MKKSTKGEKSLKVNISDETPIIVYTSIKNYKLLQDAIANDIKKELKK